MKKGLGLFVIVLIFLGMFMGIQTVNADSNGLGITIDGSFDDWTDKPKTQISSPGDDFNIKEGSLLADTTNIYFFLNMSESGTGYIDLQPAGYKLIIGGKVYYLTFSNVINDNSTTSKEIDVTAWCETDGKNYSLPNAKIIEVRKPVGSGHSDMVEFSIPYGDLGLDSTIVNEISVEISNPNLGTQVITTTGGSTGPYVIAGVGLVMAIGTLYFVKHKKYDKVNLMK